MLDDEIFEAVLNNILAVTNLDQKIEEMEKMLAFFTDTVPKDARNTTFLHFTQIVEYYLNIVAYRPMQRSYDVIVDSSNLPSWKYLMACIKFYHLHRSRQLEGREMHPLSIYRNCKVIGANQNSATYDTTKFTSFISTCEKKVAEYISDIDLTHSPALKIFLTCKKSGKVITNRSCHGTNGFYSFDFKDEDEVRRHISSACAVCCEDNINKKLLLIHLNEKIPRGGEGDVIIKHPIVSKEYDATLATVLHIPGAVSIPLFEYTPNDIFLSKSEKMTVYDDAKIIQRLHIPGFKVYAVITFLKVRVAKNEIPIHLRFIVLMTLVLYDTTIGVVPDKTMCDELDRIIPGLSNLSDFHSLLINYYHFTVRFYPHTTTSFELVELLFSQIQKTVTNADDVIPTYTTPFNNDNHLSCVVVKFPGLWDVKPEHSEIYFHVHIYFHLIRYLATKRITGCLKYNVIQKYKHVIARLVLWIKSTQNSYTIYRYLQSILLHLGIVFMVNYDPDDEMCIERVQHIRELYQQLREDECKQVFKAEYFTLIQKDENGTPFDEFIKDPPPPPLPKELNIPRFKCPITLDVFTDPVIAADGFTYERRAIKEYLKSHNISPLTRQKLKHTKVYSNKLLRFEIQDITGKVMVCESDSD